MKKLVYYLVLTILIVSGCSKDRINEQVIDENSVNKSEIRLVTLTDGSKTSITMLEFTSVDHYEATISSLKALLEQQEDAFYQSYGSLSESAYNDKLKETGFDDQQALIEFETMYNIPGTMRQAYVATEEEWLNNDILDPVRDPSNIYVYSNVEMTLLNPDGEVKIGDFILKLTKDGFIEIADMDVPTLIRIKNGDMTALSEPTVTTNIEIDGGGKSGDCSSSKSRNYIDPYQSNFKVKKHVHFHSYPWKGVSEAEITSYKKSGNKWEKYSINLGVANQSYFRDKNCYPKSQEWSGWKRKNAKSISKSVSFWGAFPQYRAENGQSVYGYFEYAGFSNSMVLTW